MIDELLRATEELASAAEAGDAEGLSLARSRREDAFRGFAEQDAEQRTRGGDFARALARVRELDAQLLALASRRQAAIRVELDGILALRREQQSARASAAPRFVSRRV